MIDSEWLATAEVPPACRDQSVSTGKANLCPCLLRVNIDEERTAADYRHCEAKRSADRAAFEGARRAPSLERGLRRTLFSMMSQTWLAPSWPSQRSVGQQSRLAMGEEARCSCAPSSGIVRPYTSRNRAMGMALMIPAIVRPSINILVSSGPSTADRIVAATPDANAARLVQNLRI